MNSVNSAETSGSRTMSQAFSTNQFAATGAANSCPITWVLPLEEVHLVDVDRLPVAVDQDHDREPDPHFGGGHRDHEQGEHLTGDVVQGLPERHEVEVDGVQHELDRHQDEHRVAPSEHAVDPGREQGGRQEQHEREPDHGRSSFLESTIAPISAARSRSEITSNGRTNRLKSDVPTDATEPSIGSMRGASQSNAPWIRYTRPARIATATRNATPRRWLSSASRPIGALVSMRPNRN